MGARGKETGNVPQGVNDCVVHAAAGEGDEMHTISQTGWCYTGYVDKDQ